MKKISVLLLAVIILLSCMPAVVAADPFTLTVGTVTAQKGESIVVPITVSGASKGFFGPMFKVQYDANLALTNMALGSDYTDGNFAFTKPNKFSEHNPVNITIDAIDPSYTEGTLINLTFTAPQEPGEYPISLICDPANFADENFKSFTPVTVSGKVVVEESVVRDSRLAFTGAQVRTTGEQGLRFIFSIDTELYDTLDLPESKNDTGVGFGAVVFPKAYLGDNELTKETSYSDGTNEYVAKIVPAVNLFEDGDDQKLYTACMTGIPENNYKVEYVAVPYATYMDGEKEVTVYGNESTNITVFSVADKAYSEKTEREEVLDYLYNNILVKVDTSYEK